MIAQANAPLPRGFRLNRYRIEHPLSRGGFSLVYFARDEAGAPVAIKEYLPATLCQRQQGATLPHVAPEHEPAFRYGMKCFFEEGRTLARLRHPNVVRVLNFFRANGTVYMVMQFEPGRTLSHCIRHQRAQLSDAFLRALFVRLLNGLREVHAYRLLHLDIKPANIYLRTDGTPVLLDFGAARQTLALEQPMLKPMYTPGFASPEHYGDHSTLGPWSDIYSVGASLYACITGRAPPRADHRRSDDFPLMRPYLDRYSRQLLETVSCSLRLDPLERPQSVYSLQKMLALVPAAAAPEPHIHFAI